MDLLWLEALPDAAIVADAAGVIIAANELAVGLFGYPHSTLLGLSIDQLVPDAARARHGQHRADYAAHPRARRMAAGQNLMARRGDGTLVPVDISLAPIAGGRVLAVARDAHTRASETRYRELLDQLIAAQRETIAAQASMAGLTARVTALEVERQS